jgi:hypothetical protein
MRTHTSCVISISTYFQQAVLHTGFFLAALHSSNFIMQKQMCYYYWLEECTP